VAKTEKTPSLTDHYHIWICEKGHTHTELGPLYETISATPLTLALSGKSQKKTQNNWLNLANLSTVATPPDKIIDALEAEIIKLKTQLSDTEEKYQKMRKKFDDLMIKMHGGGRKWKNTALS